MCYLKAVSNIKEIRARLGFAESEIVPRQKEEPHPHWDRTKCIQGKMFLYTGLCSDAVDSFNLLFGVFSEPLEDFYSSKCYDLIKDSKRIGYFELDEFVNCKVFVQFWSTDTEALLLWQSLIQYWERIIE